MLGELLGLAGGATSAALAAREAAKNRRFQKKMYKNRFKYSMADMRRSGLNPILAASSGLGGGGSPSGSMASMPDLGNTASQAIKTGSEKKQRTAQTAVLESQLGLLDEQILETRAKTEHQYASARLADNQASRWQPVADIGGAAHGVTGRIKDFADSTKSPYFRQNMRNMVEPFFNTAKDVERWIRRKSASPSHRKTGRKN